MSFPQLKKILNLNSELESGISAIAISKFVKWLINFVREISKAEELISKYLRNLSKARQNQLEKCLSTFRNIAKKSGQKNPTSFEWVDSPLVEAVESGYWILIENVIIFIHSRFILDKFLCPYCSG